MERGSLSLRRGMALTGASEATLRRDFAGLAERGVVQRSWGGIGLPAGDGISPFAFRQVQFSAEKAALARLAAGLLKAGDVVFIDGDTTTHHLAACLPDFPLRIVTNSLRLAESLGTRHGRKAPQDIYLTGGLVHAPGGLLIGAGVLASLREHHANWTFISVSGVTDEGLYNTDDLVVQAEREMMRNADRIALLADHSKLGKFAMCRIGDVTEVDVLITDADPARSTFLPRLAREGVKVLTPRTCLG